MRLSSCISVFRCSIIGRYRRVCSDRSCESALFDGNSLLQFALLKLNRLSFRTLHHYSFHNETVNNMTMRDEKCRGVMFFLLIHVNLINNT